LALPTRDKKKKKKPSKIKINFIFRGRQVVKCTKREVWQKGKKSHFRTHRKLIKELFFFFLGTHLASYLIFCTNFYLHGSSKLVNFVQFFFVCVFSLSASSLLLLLLPSYCGFAVPCPPPMCLLLMRAECKSGEVLFNPLSLVLLSLFLSPHFFSLSIVSFLFQFYNCIFFYVAFVCRRSYLSRRVFFC